MLYYISILIFRIFCSVITITWQKEKKSNEENQLIHLLTTGTPCPGTLSQPSMGWQSSKYMHM